MWTDMEPIAVTSAADDATVASIVCCLVLGLLSHSKATETLISLGTSAPLWCVLLALLCCPLFTN